MILLILVLAFAGVANAELTIDRVWDEPNSGYAYALVTYKNTSGTTYSGGVTIECVALDSTGKRINKNSRSFFSHEYGPIQPGFEDTLKVPVKLAGGDMASMTCKERGR